MPFNPSTDFTALSDGLEAVTLYRRGTTAGSPGAAITHALRRAVTTREAEASDGRYTASDTVWHLSAAELDGPPRLGDVVRDAGGCRWTVLSAARTTLGTRWRCIARSLAIVYALDDTITVLQAVYVKGCGGAAEPTWRTWKTGVRARIELAAAEPVVRHQARRTALRCRIFVAENLALDHAHRIQGPDGTVYKVLGTSGAERIGELQTITVEATP